MSRTAAILAAAVIAILLVMNYPVQAALVLGAVAAAGILAVAAARMVYVLLRPWGQRIVKRMCLRQWSKMPEKNPCPDCGGLGIVDKNKRKYLRSNASLAHIIFAAANSRNCRRCAGSGYVTPVVIATEIPAGPPEPHVIPPPPGGWDVQ